MALSYIEELGRILKEKPELPVEEKLLNASENESGVLNVKSEKL